ncbi:hypothetical protein IAQ61_002151 [Plenodomus lingam]|uniref:uncharacterized protein n=1 Tax=Leptosphaeria maculans TaxID=5022 RepID=UPI003317284B|nr:hypothetical protein IAQ61_002151 [Plenodomus lingam]
MGQANSSGQAEPPPRRRSRPLSWAPLLLSRPSQQQQPQQQQQQPQQQQQQHHYHHHQQQQSQPPHATTLHDGGEDDALHTLLHSPLAQGPTTPVTRRNNPFHRLSSHFGRPDAGPSLLDPPPPLTRPRSRLQRARSSLGSISGLLHYRPSLSGRNSNSNSNSNTDLPADSSSSPPLSPRPPPARSVLRRAPAHDQDPFLPRVQVPDLGFDFDQLMQNNVQAQDPDTPGSPFLAPSTLLRRDGRALSMLPAQRRLRNMMSSPRRRRSVWHDEDHLGGVERRRQGEDQADVLSRLLSLAAAATAASLVGDDNQQATQDGTFDTFLESLENGSIASALRGNEGPDSSEAAGGTPAPLNFFRMFRFGTSTESRTGTRAGSRGSVSGGAVQDGEDGSEGRMVPIIIVGIRSITPGAGTGQDDSNIPPFLDALSSFPTPPTSPGDANEHVLRPPQNGTRFSHRRRASMGGFNFPSNYDSQRHHRAHAQDRPRPWSSVADDSPTGPLPPPSTPATMLGLSAEPSGTTTPAVSTSPPSPTSHSNVPSRRESVARRPNGSSLEPTVEEPQTSNRSARPRRLSESDFTRYGSGAARRRGVVEPDDNPGEGSRSWIIYVLGGSYPENHPLLTTPSLFTDSPTYEDMMLLSSLLGPAKPPVASEEDVASAPGLFRIRGGPGTLIAEATEGVETLNLATDARCLVCLCEFEAEEEARKLVKCEHLFHRICIDQWLTTGRNSCPLCRGEGVQETNKDDAEAPEAESAPFVQPVA